MHIKGHGVSVSSAMSISTVTTSAPPAFPLFITLMAAFTSSMVGGSLQISKSSTAGGISVTCSEILAYLECFQNVPSSVQAFRKNIAIYVFYRDFVVLKPLFM